MPTHFRGSPEQVRALDAYIKLFRAANSVRAPLQRRLAGLGLTESQFGVLELLYHLGPTNQKGLSEKLLTAGGNITMVVDNLEKLGLARRVRVPEDRRSVQVHLTSKGRELIARIFPGHADELARRFAPLTPSEQEQLARLCRKLGLANVAMNQAEPE